MPVPPREEWLQLASEVGVIVAPAGLNFVVGSTTWWLYALDAETLVDLVPKPWALQPTGTRLPFQPRALRRELPRLGDIDARWRAALARSQLRPPRVQIAPAMLRQLKATERELPGFALRDFIVRSAALLEGLRLIPEYHRPDEPGPGYLFDLLENGLTTLHLQKSPTPG